MTIQVRNSNVSIAPRKVRQVCDLVRNRPVSEALEILRFNEKKAIALLVTKLLNSGLDIASKSGKYDLDALKVGMIRVDEGPTMKRIRARAQGRAFRIRHRSSHILVELNEA